MVYYSTGKRLLETELTPSYSKMPLMSLYIDKLKMLWTNSLSFIKIYDTCKLGMQKRRIWRLRSSVSHKNDGHNSEFLILMFNVVNFWLWFLWLTGRIASKFVVLAYLDCKHMSQQDKRLFLIQSSLVQCEFL